MKIGIITFWQSKENYGELLQACALQIFLEEKGHHPFIIRYDKAASINGQKPKLLQRMREIHWSRLLDPSAVLQKLHASFHSVPPQPSRHFDDFSADFLKFYPGVYRTCQELRDAPPDADVYITGSDQVWNHHYTGDCEPFFLLFGPPNIRRLAYAASFGHRHLPARIRSRYRQCLKHLDAISVREASGVTLCHLLGRKDAELMPDPTLLINKERWIQYSTEIEAFSSSHKRKVLIYTLGNRSSNVKKDLVRYIKSLPNTEVVHISINKDFSGTTYATVPEWLGYYHQADLVVTNSYHGTTFAILFNKNFISIASSGDKAGMNERHKTLLKKMDLDDHLLHSFSQERVEQLMSRCHDWSLVNSKIENWRKDADRFLEFEPTMSYS